MHVYEEGMKNAAIECSTKYFKTFCELISFRDKTCKKLRHNEVRDKAIEKVIEHSECDYKDAYQFLGLLKRTT